MIRPKNFLLELTAKRPWVVLTGIIVCLTSGKQSLGGMISIENGT